MAQTRLELRHVILALVVVVGVGGYLVVSVYGDLLWFEAVGYDQVYLTILGYRIAMFLVGTLVSFAAFYVTARIALRNVRKTRSVRTPRAYLAGLLVLAALFGVRYSSAWEVVIRFLNSVPFGVTDPAYGQGVGFYVYTIPLLNLVVGFFVIVTSVSFVIALSLYARHFGIVAEAESEDETAFDVATFFADFRQYGFGHVSAIVGVFFVLLGIGYFIDRYELVFSTRGMVFGIGATDHAIFQPLLLLLTATGVLGGIALIANAGLRDDRAFYIPIAILLGFLIVGTAAGAAYQSFVVQPDEFNKEVGFIEHEINYTRQGFALNRIEDREFPVATTINASEIETNPGTIDNVRLWDARPMLTTYNEIQIFRTYYTFSDVDVDRYPINGSESQVMVSARELDFNALSPDSQSWVNRHLVYTHGYGVVMSPVGKTTSEGLPDLYIQDIPPTSTKGPNITQPRIYYGENTNDYAIVNTRTRELDYPKGNQNAYTNYGGDGGVVLDSAFRELLYSAKFGALSIFLSDSVTDQSRLQFNRDLETRVKRITPFLKFDGDPYVVVSDGEIKWIYDAYTTTGQYPYSKRIQFKGERTNYVRNSVKVVIDANSGNVTYYVADSSDPLIQTYRNAFPGLFEDLDAMPMDLRRHIRYPEDAFTVQAQMYLTYHMEDPEVFYNKEDVWRVPNEITRGSQVDMEPYYIIMRFPDAESPEFVMIQPYVPRGKENMIGWLAARSDPPNYGNLRAYRFSKQQLIYGPMQIESRISQDTDISQRITLWSQAGSSVIRGNLLAIPIGDTIMYVEPLFLVSQDSGALPEMKRVIVAQGDQLTMQPTFQESLAARFGTAQPSGPSGPGPGLTPNQLQELQTLYSDAQAALQRGDFQTYAQKISALGNRLDRFESQQASNTTVPGNVSVP